MKKQVIKDERLEFEKMKIASAAFGILVLGMVIDVFYKLSIDAPFQSYMGELIIMFLAGLFYLFEGTRKGVLELFSNAAEKRLLKVRYLLTNTVLAVSFAIVDYLRGAVQTTSDLLYLTAGVVAFIVVGYFIDWYIMKKSNKNIDNTIEK